MKKDKYIGKIINGYEILGIVGKAMDGHKEYEAKCTKCGFIWNARINTIERSRDYTCQHKIRQFINTRLAAIFKGMYERCYNPLRKEYRFYGGKGITICEEWLKDHTRFEKWAVENGYSDGLSIDRIDEKKGYTPENCRWVTLKDNSKWKSTTREITVNGITDSGRGWSKRLGFGINYINKMIRQKGVEETTGWIQEKIS